MSDVTIIGAGVAGLWAAKAALACGLRPRLIDRHGAPGVHHCSWWAGGMLAPDCEGAVTEAIVVDHGRAAAALWASVTPVHYQGTLVLTLDRDRADLDRFAARSQGHRFVDAGELAALEPALAPRHRRGLFFPAEAHLDPRRALADLVTALAAQGVAIEGGEADPEGIAGPVIDCRGLAAQDDLPGLRGVRGEMMILHSEDIILSRPVRLLHPRHPLYIVPRTDGLFMLGATQIESAAAGPVTARSALELLSAAYALDPRFGEASIVDMGAAPRPAFIDNVPRIIQRGRILYINGLFRHGYLMAPVLAQQAAAFLAKGVKGDLIHED